MTAEPFVKWAGGKRQLLPAILKRLPKKMGTYFEPFVGGGAVFFALAHRKAFDRAVINDVNKELMAAFRVLASGQVEALISLLQTYPYDPEFFERMRRTETTTDVEIAARFIYLNRTGFNGLYRVNQKGEFNVPFGKYTNPTICNSEKLRAAAQVLEGVTIEVQDFAASVASAQKGDVVYFDPPYLPVSPTANFTSYTKDGFTFAEHERLAATFRDLADRGVGVLLSNSDTKTTRKLYKGFRVGRVQAKRAINSAKDKRGLVNEVLVQANLSPA